MRRTLAAVLAAALAVQPSLAGAVNIKIAPMKAAPISGAAAGAIPLQLPAFNSASPQADHLRLGLPATPTLRHLNSVDVDGAADRAAVSAAAVSAAAVKEAVPAGYSRKVFRKKVQTLAEGARKSVAGLPKMSASKAKTASAEQFSLLTGVRLRRTRNDVAPVAAASAFGKLNKSGLKVREDNVEVPPAASFDTPKKPEAKKKKWGTPVFRDPERNKSFWRLFWSEIVFYVGFQMYIVALPFLMKAFTRNTLAEAGTLDGLTAEEITALVRENRSLARIAHWAAQAVAYISIPIFTRGGKTAPTKLVLRAAIPRALILAAIPVIFFASGMVSASAALWILTGLIAAQSFAQGLHITFQSGGIARLLGHPDVLASERIRANAIRTRWSAVIAILAPVLAGHIALIGNWMGKEGVGSAVIYGIYAGSVALSGLIYASIKLLSKPLPNEKGPGVAEGDVPKTAGFGGALKSVLVSMKNGIKLVLGNRFLRVYVGLALVSALFADPLVFNVLPEFVETVLAANPGAVAGILSWLGGLPVAGGVLHAVAAWFFQGLTGTPMGFFAMLIASSSIGSLLATSLIKPARKLFNKFGFKTEEALAIPFYAIAALSVPAFWLMIHTGSFWGLLGLYGLQTFLGSFAMILITGVFQKNLDGFKKKRYQILSATSFVSILAAIAATYLYGFVLSDISIQTSLYIAAIATTILGGLQLAAPWLMFRKDQRKNKFRGRPKPDEEPAPFPDHPPEKGHLPNNNGPLSFGL